MSTGFPKGHPDLWVSLKGHPAMEVNDLRGKPKGGLTRKWHDWGVGPVRAS